MLAAEYYINPGKKILLQKPGKNFLTTIQKFQKYYLMPCEGFFNY